jgi:uncharacterized protein YebE (UPF0316 family)
VTQIWHTLTQAVAAFDWFGLVVIPIAIVCARVTDVSVGTLRVVFIGRGMALPAVVAGFFESLIWLLAVSQILKHLTLPLYYVAYAGGFALGNYVGLRIERWLALGKVILQVITNQPVGDLVAVFREVGLGATVIEGEGSTGPVHVVYSVLGRRDLRSVLQRIKGIHPNAFYTIEPVATVSQGVFPTERQSRPSRMVRQRK